MDDDRETSSTVDDILIPTDTKGNALSWDGNYAKVPGLMNEINKHCVRKGLLQPFLKHGVALASNGRTAVPSTINIVPLVQGLLPDGDAVVPIVYNLLVNLRPETAAERVTKAQAGLAARDEPVFDFTKVVNSPDFPVNIAYITLPLAPSLSLCISVSL